jgi:hypothetical protein
MDDRRPNLRLLSSSARWVTDLSSVVAFAVAFALTAACNLSGEGASAGYSTQSTGDGGDGGPDGGPGGDGGVDETGTGPAACEYNPQGACVAPQDCCVNVPRLPAAGSDAPGCTAGAEYPNRWDCDNGTCVNLGCQADGDCVLNGFYCRTIVDDMRPHCVHTCTDNADCVSMPDTSCVDRISGGGGICFPDS